VPLCDFRLEHRDWGRSGARIEPWFGRALRLLQANTLANAWGETPSAPEGHASDVRNPDVREAREGVRAGFGSVGRERCRW
jgi:hypothetical protein